MTTVAPVPLWVLEKGGRVATCEALRHPLGLEVVLRIGQDDVRRTQVARSAVEAQQVADDWRQLFVTAGWQVPADA